MAMSVELNCVELEDFISKDTVQQNGFTVWSFLDMMNSGKVTRGMDQEITSMAIEEVYREIGGDVLKEVGYLKTIEQYGLSVSQPVPHRSLSLPLGQKILMLACLKGYVHSVASLLGTPRRS